MERFYLWMQNGGSAHHSSTEIIFIWRIWWFMWIIIDEDLSLHEMLEKRLTLKWLSSCKLDVAKLTTNNLWQTSCLVFYLRCNTILENLAFIHLKCTKIILISSNEFYNQFKLQYIRIAVKYLILTQNFYLNIYIFPYLQINEWNEQRIFANGDLDCL